MNNIVSHVPRPVNEPVREYRPASPERRSLRHRLEELKREHVEVPAFISGREVRTGHTEPLIAPHERARTLGTLHQCGPAEVAQAINAARKAQKEWAAMHWTDRAAVFLKAADLLAGPWRDTLNASTMLGQSKNPHQAEIDAACEMIDFFRFNVAFMQQIYEDQPLSVTGTWNRMQYRPLEGFVFAVTPFNFTSIQGNLATAPALMGNAVLWKPSSTAAYSAFFIYKLLEEAGLPPGVINLLPGGGPEIGDPVFASPHFAGLHFTGSTKTFERMWQTIGGNIARYSGYPRIVGETGGKDFIIAHGSADPRAVSTAIVRGGFEYQGQKCSAVSRVYVARSIWSEVREDLKAQMEQIRVGPVEDFSNFMNAVIDEKSFNKISAYLSRAAEAEGVEVLHGGGFNAEEGFFIEPTVLVVQDPRYQTMCEEIFGPVVSVYVYEDAELEATLDIVDTTSPYALTGAIFANDRAVVARALDRLTHAAGNFYINDKPTGAVVGQQPFGGSRASGTNDKAGSYLNLLRWVSPRAIKETFSPPRHFAYPYLQPDPASAALADSGDGHNDGP